MGINEALKLLVKMQYAYQKMGLSEYTEALKIATHAIDDELFYEHLRTAHVPLSCVVNADEGKETLAYCCPNCGKSDLNKAYQYCPNCGQALEWRDDDEQEKSMDQHEGCGTG